MWRNQFAGRLMVRVMTFSQLIERIVADGTASVLKYEKRPEKIRGCLAGFDMLSKIKEPADIAKTLVSRRSVEHDMVLNRVESVESEVYWEHRCCTAQFEYAWEILKVGLGAPALSGRAVMKYAEIVGTKP